ncbi:hypothetical protein [Pedobacter insulae]|nr:hypothetical protein [Pedobacter insulae]
MPERLNIKNNGFVAYIRISELPQHEQELFRKWLLADGQTRPVIEEETDPLDCAYPWDYELWKSNPNATHLL